ncbi:MAG: VWA domain-containing protein [Pseudomonadales bacterium]
MRPIQSAPMDVTLTRFVHALRSADLQVSPAETLDGFAVVQAVGLMDPRLLQDALALTLAKTREEKQRFAECFERFFHQLAFRRAPKRSPLRGLDSAKLLEILDPEKQPVIRQVIDEILHGDRTALAYRVQREAERLQISGMQTLRDKARIGDLLSLALGGRELEQLLSRSEDFPAAQLPALRYLRQYIQEQVRDYVDLQYQLAVDATGRRALLAAALKGNLDQLPPDYYREVDRVVAKLAQRLSQRHRARAKKTRRGHLDIKRTLRANIAYDGALFDLHWRQRHRQPSTVYVVCDVSNSVSRIARFLLLLLHGLTDALPQVRAFAFSNRLGEISEDLRGSDVDAAVAAAMFDWGKGATDYGAALTDLRNQVGADLDRHSTLIFLGDARANFYDPRVDVLRGLARRVRQVFWLNPESRDRWGEGDSVMPHYAPYCLRVDVCRDLQDIERFADRLLSATR